MAAGRGGRTSIEWTDRTWNPVTGCSKVSPGCAHCYAEGVAERFWATQYPPIQLPTGDPSDPLNVRPRGFTDVQTHEDRLLAPLSWRKPARVFVNSMSDLFHEDVPDEFILRVLDVIRQCQRHTFQVLSKRPERMRALMSRLRFDSSGDGLMWLADAIALDRQGQPISFARLLKNLWLGVSVENQPMADKRIGELLQTPAAVRFISAEPLLGDVDVTPWLTHEGACVYPALGKPTRGLDWVIVGGESGPGARPFGVAWARSIVQQCHAAGVPVFVKQLGAHVVDRNDAGFEGDPGDSWTPETRYEELMAQGWQGDPVRIRLRDRKGGDPAEWPEDLRVREWPEMRT